MSGSAPTNSAAVDFEKQQAAEADAKEAARQQRLSQGQTLIDQIFNGQPVMGTKTSNYDWSGFTPGFGITPATGAPSGYTAVRTPAAAAAPAAGAPGGVTLARGPTGATASAGQLNPARYNPAATDNSAYAVGGAGRGGLAAPATDVASGGGAGASGWGLQDASGKIYRQGDPLSITSQYDTGQKTGGFDDAFYNNYRQKVLDYYNPDEARQYDMAKRDLTYNLARAGTLQSSTAGDKQGELAYNDALQKANIVANANTQTGNLKNQIQSNKQSLINQLYATEDPTLTANLAESSAAASRLQDPNLTPAAALFTPALSAVGSAVSNFASPYTLYGGGTGAAGTTSPTPAAASASSGKLSGGVG